MKKTINLLLVVLLLASCDKEASQPIPVSLSLGESVEVFDNYTVRADSIQDSRCPLAVDCVWAGIVTTFLTLETPGKGSEVLQLCNGDADGCRATGDFEELQVRLDSVTPYPISIIKDEDYRVHLDLRLMQ